MSQSTICPPYHSFLHRGIPVPTIDMDRYMEEYYPHVDRASPTYAMVITSFQQYYPLDMYDQSNFDHVLEENVGYKSE